MNEVEVGENGIRLGQLLKLAGLVESGGAAKLLLGTGEVAVNGVTESRRGAALKAGDVVTCQGERIRLT